MLHVIDSQVHHAVDCVLICSIQVLEHLQQPTQIAKLFSFLTKKSINENKVERKKIVCMHK